MKTKKLTKKIENIILRKKINKFNFFTLEYCTNTKSFFKKNKTHVLIPDKNLMKHPLKVNDFTSLNSLKLYLQGGNKNIIYIYINNVYIKRGDLKNLYIESDTNTRTLFAYLKKIYGLWSFI